MELKPCPFCGSLEFPRVKRFQFPPDSEGGAWEWGYHVVCDASGIDGEARGCGACSGWGETPEEAIAAWNRRAAPAPTVSGDLAKHDANLARWKAERIHPAPTRAEALEEAVTLAQEYLDAAKSSKLDWAVVHMADSIVTALRALAGEKP